MQVKQSFSLLAFPLLISACASPKVYDEAYPMDHRMSCAQMERAIDEVEATRADAKESRGLTFRNVFTTAVFFPATIATYDNVDESRRAGNERQKHLMELYSMKGCNAESQARAGGSAQPIVIMMPSAIQATQPVSGQYSQVVELTSAVPSASSGRRYSDAHIYSSAYLFE